MAAAARHLFEPADLDASRARLADLRRWLGGTTPQPDLDVVGSAAHAALSRELAERALTRTDRAPDGGEPAPIARPPTTPDPRDHARAGRPDPGRHVVAGRAGTRAGAADAVRVGRGGRDPGLARATTRSRRSGRAAMSFDAVVDRDHRGAPPAGAGSPRPGDRRQPESRPSRSRCGRHGTPRSTRGGVPAICTYSILPDPLEALARALAGEIGFPGRAARWRSRCRPHRARAGMTLRDEIREQPDVAARLLADQADAVEAIAASLRDRPVRHVVIAARGTSDHAAIYAQYVLGVRHRLSVGLGTPSIVSLYGAAPDVARRAGHRDQPVGRLAGHRRGHRRGACARAPRRSRSPTSRARRWPRRPTGRSPSAPARNGRSPRPRPTRPSCSRSRCCRPRWPTTRPTVRRSRPSREALALAARARARHRARSPRDQAAATRALVIARGYEYATAREWALKLKELAHVFADPYSSADFQHGPLALVEPGVPVLAVARAGAAGGGPRRAPGAASGGPRCRAPGRRRTARPPSSSRTLAGRAPGGDAGVARTDRLDRRRPAPRVPPDPRPRPRPGCAAQPQQGHPHDLTPRPWVRGSSRGTPWSARAAGW